MEHDDTRSKERKINSMEKLHKHNKLEMVCVEE